MTEFTEDQLRLIHKAVRYYQMNGTVVGSEEYRRCEPILKETFSAVKAATHRRDAVCDM